VIRRLQHGLAVLRHPIHSLQGVAGDGPLYPLLILFGLNAVDELDRAAFGILLPEIRDEFGFDYQGLLSLLAVVSATSLALQVPIAGMADRYPRIRLALVGALAWSVCSFYCATAWLRRRRPKLSPITGPAIRSCRGRTTGTPPSSWRLPWASIQPTEMRTMPWVWPCQSGGLRQIGHRPRGRSASRGKP